MTTIENTIIEFKQLEINYEHEEIMLSDKESTHLLSLCKAKDDKKYISISYENNLKVIEFQIPTVAFSAIIENLDLFSFKASLRKLGTNG